MNRRWNALACVLSLGLAASGCLLERWDFHPLDGGAYTSDVARARDGGATDTARDAELSSDAAVSDGSVTDAAASDAACAAGQSACEGACVNLQSDPANCGECGRRCASPAGATGVCAAGQCSYVCNAGSRDCDGRAENGCEARPADDPMNCGACGNRCVSAARSSATCVAGACQIRPEEGFGDCDRDPSNGAEADLRASTAHCGECGRACAAAPHARPVCRSSACALVCEDGWEDCDGDLGRAMTNGCEVQVQNDARHCGRCGNACAAVEVCSSGRCGSVCQPGQTRCDSRCVNLASDETGCGACGRVCAAPAGARATCANGTCGYVCNERTGDCDGNAANGCEAATNTSERHCGRCGNACPTPPHATPVCRASVCGFTCEVGWADCDGSAANGCEVNVQTSTSHCGTCGNLCPLRPHATATCTNGACGDVPEPGWADCDRNLNNGYEARVSADAANCGACGRVCPAAAGATATCSNGVCGAGPCRAGFSDCNGDLADGCEVAPASDTNHCGACGNRCRLANATAQCVAGACRVLTCAAGFADCDGDANNGCEVSTATDSSHCNGCGRACPAGQRCSGGACGTLCSPPAVVCGSACVTTTTEQNCGACGRVCPPAPHARPWCAGASGAPSTCALQCEVNWGDCDRVIDNGCEEPVNTSAAHCGGCGRRCDAPPNAAAVCQAGACGFVCNAGFGDCDGVAGNGCEARLDATTSCGACGRQCPARSNAQTTCTAGACGYACLPGWGDADGNATNGCEANLATDPNHCGRVGNRCAALPNAAAACASGQCVLGVCLAGFTNCDGNATNGCETPTASDANNCGGCGVRCAFANAQATCAGGVCTLGACAAGYGNCDGNAANGCETVTSNDPANCGACARRCNTAGGEICSQGTCASQCAPGVTFCAGLCVSLASDARHCGACGNACPTPAHTTTGCVAARCAITACEQGWADCDANAVNGCEASTSTGLAHCGRCGNACPTPPHATPVCRAGACGYTCLAGWGDCDGQVANGCETNLTTDTNNCGACGTRCAFANAGATCAAGACAMGPCAAGWGNCDAQVANGCEASLGSTANCGACGNTCTSGAQSSPICLSQACGFLCQSGWRNCNGVASDGCEVQTNTTTNCGGCNVRCALAHATATCTTGRCQISRCAVGWVDGDGDDANGCEEPLTICRTCTVRCPIGRICDCGSCVGDLIL